MDKTKTQKQVVSEKYAGYIISCINSEGYDVFSDSLNTPEAKLRFLHDTFVSEYWHDYNKKRYVTKQNAFREWIMGLPSSFDIEWENYRIIELAKRMGSLADDATYKQEEAILDNYFSFITNKVFVLFKKYKIVE